MSGETRRGKGSPSEGPKHQPRARFTQGLLNNERILKALNIKAGQTIIDAGCGNGYMSKVFSNQVGRRGRYMRWTPIHIL